MPPPCVQCLQQRHERSGNFGAATLAAGITFSPGSLAARMAPALDCCMISARMY